METDNTALTEKYVHLPEKETGELLELVHRGNKEGIWDWDIRTNEIYFSPDWKKQLGYSDSDLENSPATFKMLLHPDDNEIYQDKLRNILNSSSSTLDMEYRMKHKDGTYRWIWARAAALRDRDGTVYRLAGSHTDVTETKEQIRLFQDNILFQKIILDKLQDAFIVIRNNEIIEVNDTFFKMLGYVAEDLRYLKLTDLFIEERRPEFIHVKEQLLNIGNIFSETECRKKDGSTIEVEITATTLSKAPLLSVLFMRDITGRNNVRKKLLHFQELLQYIIEHNRNAVAVHDKNMNYMYVSQPYIQLFKLEGQEIIGKNHYEVLNMTPTVKEYHQRVLKGEIIRNDASLSFFMDNKYVRWECRPWYEYDGSVGGLVLYIEDITERTLVEQLLLNEKENLKTTLLSVGDGVISTDDQGAITVMNPVAEKLTGWSFDEARGRQLRDIFRIISEETKIPNDGFIIPILRTGQIIEYTNKLVIPKAGNEVPVEMSAAPIKHLNGDITGAVIIVRDVTEKRAEQRKIAFLSYNDVLTGLYNRRYIEEALQRLDTPENLPLAVFSIDVNGLKLTNDAFGHEIGDQLLKTVANILKIVCQSDDIIGRIGGDEFCILMKRSDDEQAGVLKDKILNEVTNLKFYPVVVSLAVGFAVKYSLQEDIKSIMTVSDNRMYQDKIKFGKEMRSQTIQMALQHINLNYEQEQIHTEKVSLYCEAIARAMDFSEKEIKEIKTAGALHDIGKIMVPSHILKKGGPLSNEEFNLVKRHSEIGYQMLKTVEEYAYLSEYVLYHHERWDGLGYPVGLQGEKIPLVSRIIAVADAFEAMTAKRPYQKTKTKEAAIEELKRGMGHQFDPEIVKIFLEKAL